MTTPSQEYPNLSLIRQGIEYRFSVKIRGLQLLMRPLSVMEEDRVTQEVIDQMKSMDQENKTSLRQSSLLAIKKLAKAQTSDVGASDQKVNEIELERLTPGELDFLFKSYVAGCDKLNPILEKFDKKEVVQWVETLKKSSADLEMILIESSFFQLAALCHHLLTTGESHEAK